MAFLSIMARLGMDATGFQAGIKQAQSASAGLSKSLNSNLKGAIAGAFGTAAITGMTAKLIEQVKAIKLTSDRLGISTTSLQQFEKAATLTGSSLDEVTGFIEKMNSARDEALSGNEQMIKSFERLGVNMTALRTLRADDIFRKIGSTVKFGDPQELIGALRQVGGRSAGSLIPAFKFGLDEAAKITSVISPDEIEEIYELERAIKSLQKSVFLTFKDIFLFLVNGIVGIRDAAGMFFAFIGGAAAGIEEALRGGMRPGEGVFEFLSRISATGLARGISESGRYLDERTREEAANRNRRNQPGFITSIEDQRASQAERIARLREQVSEKEMKLLPASEQRAAVEKRIAELRKQIAAFGNQEDAELTAKEEELRLRLRAELADAQMQLAGLQEKQQSRSDLPLDPLVNSMERMGFSFRKNETPVQNQISKLSKIEMGIRESNQKLDQVVRNTGAVAEVMQ